jgi:hypothetical protein
VARLALERKLMRRPMRQVLMRLPPEMIAALDDERRRYLDIPPRNAIVRELIGEALSFRRALRPRTSGRQKSAHEAVRSLKQKEGYGGRETATGRSGNRGAAARRAAEAARSA